MAESRTAVLTVLLASGVAVAAPFIYRTAAEPNNLSLAVATYIALLVAAALLGYGLRGVSRWTTVLCAALVYAACATATSLMVEPSLTVAVRVARIASSAVTFGVLAILPDVDHTFRIDFPWVWVLFVVPTLVWQGFFEGYFGVRSDPLSEPQASAGREIS